MTRSIELDTNETAAGFRLGPFSITENGLLTVSGPVSFEDWAAAGPELSLLERSLPFAIGDWILNGEDWFGEQASQAIDQSLRLSQKTIAVYVWTAKNVPPSHRYIDRGLSYKHHQLVATLPLPQQKRWLERALEGEWTSGRLQAEIALADGKEIVDWMVLVKCGSEARQREFMTYCEQQEIACKPVFKRAKPDKKKQHTSTQARMRHVVLATAGRASRAVRRRRTA